MKGTIGAQTKTIKTVKQIDGKTLKQIIANRQALTPKIHVGDWVKYTWGREGQFTLAVVTSVTGATPQAIEAHPELHDLELYILSNGACVREGAFVEVRKPA